MNKADFNGMVDLAMADADLTGMRPVVEKELLHYEIFQALDQEGLLRSLVFQGGTSLRLCRGSDRFSEDLDFAGGKDFTSSGTERIAACIEKRIGERFGLNVKVSDPKPTKEGSLITVDKWTVLIDTAPHNRALPRQKIKLEIANVPHYTSEAVPLRNNYAFLAGMPSVLVNTESMSEILADKVIALPTSVSKNEGGTQVLTPFRVRYRDIWDIAWLLTRGAKLDPAMAMAKVADYGIKDYRALMDKAFDEMPVLVGSGDFERQMKRFVAAGFHARLFQSQGWEAHFIESVNSQFSELARALDLAANEGAKQAQKADMKSCSSLGRY